MYHGYPGRHKIYSAIFFSKICSFFLNILIQFYFKIIVGQLWYAGLLSFGKFPEVSYYWFELIIYMIMGFVGGLFGSLFNYVNYHLTLFRMR